MFSQQSIQAVLAACLGTGKSPPQFDSTVQSPKRHLLQVWFVSTPNLPVVGVAFFVFLELLAPILLFAA
jgi:hypothetical protein